MIEAFSVCYKDSYLVYPKILFLVFHLNTRTILMVSVDILYYKFLNDKEFEILPLNIALLTKIDPYCFDGLLE